MSRSIVRSKINAKYNPVQTGGGGGGSSIAVLDEGSLITSAATSLNFTGGAITASGGAAVTVNVNLITLTTAANLLALRNANNLVPGMVYWITNAPIGLYTSGYFFIRALQTNQLEACGILEYEYSSVPLRHKPIDCWYDLDTNTHIKLSDANNRNTIEGWTNIQNFLTLCAGNLLDTNYSDNTIINDSIFTINSTYLEAFKHNYISNSTVDLTNFTGNTFSTNSIEDSFVVLNSSSISAITDNIIINSSINTHLGSINLNSFFKNRIEFSTIDFYDPITHFQNFSYNQIKDSNITLNNADIIGVTYNEIHKSVISFITCTLNSLTSNVINVTTLTINGVLAAGQYISNNEINDSIIELPNCELNHCNINGMGLGSVALIDTNTSYNYCNYRLLEDSTFYATYDIDNTVYYSPALLMLIIPTGHETWVGKILLTSTLGAGVVGLRDITNPSVTQKYSIYIDNTITRLDIDIISGFFVFPSAVISPFKMGTAYDFAYFDGRLNPIGVSIAGESVMIGYDNY